MADLPDVANALASALEGINAPTTTSETLQAIVDVARVSMAEVDHVGVTLAHAKGHLVTDALTDPLVKVLDQLQYDVGEGPCVEALADEAGPGVVVAERLRHEARWHGWVPGALDHGVRSVLAVALHTGGGNLGVLNMYSTSSDVLSEETRSVAPLFAAQAAYAYGYTHQIGNLEAALESRQMIGNAVGVVMERYGLSSERAFEYLVRAAATSQVKIRVIAEELLRDSSMRPGSAAPRPGRP